MAELIELPVEYKEYLEVSGPFEGFTTGDEMPGYVELWRLEDIQGNNSDIQINEYAPGYLAFAGNGGGEILAFDACGAVFMLPLIGMDPECAIPVAGSFAELVARFEHGA